MKKKNLIAIVAAGVITLSLVFCAAALVSPDEDYDLFSYIDGDFVYTEWYDNTVRIIEYRGSDENLTIPAYIKNTKVMTIGTGFMSNNDNIKSVTVEQGIEFIADDAFSKCVNLESISLPTSLRTIGNNAFSDCPSIKSIENGNPMVVGVGVFSIRDAEAELSWLDMVSRKEKLGDVNLDNEVNSNDVQVLEERVQFNKYQFNKYQIVTSDLDFNGKVNEKDLEILRKLVE